MFKKVIIFSLVLALLAAALPGSAGQAAPSLENVYGNRYGKVLAVSPTSVTIEQFNEAVKTILVSSTTKYFRATGAKRSLSDVKVGAWVFASGVNDASRNLVASVVVLVGRKYLTEAYWGYPLEFGTVISVDPSAGVFFTRTDKSGLVKTINYGGTRFLNKKVNKVSKIQVGMKVIVAGPKQPNGFILATVVLAFKPPRR